MKSIRDDHHALPKNEDLILNQIGIDQIRPIDTPSGDPIVNGAIVIAEGLDRPLCHVGRFTEFLFSHPRSVDDHECISPLPAGSAPTD
jgi:hypothetical protein